MVVVGVKPAVHLAKSVFKMSGAARLEWLGKLESDDRRIIVVGRIRLVRPCRFHIAIKGKGGGAGRAVVG